jgi:SAM-dependent methyltransferase
LIKTQSSPPPPPPLPRTRKNGTDGWRPPFGTILDADEIAKARDRMEAFDSRRNGPHHMWVTARSFEIVRDRLGLSGPDLDALKDLRVLVGGEGASDFARTLGRDYGARPIALDRWYRLSAKEIDKSLLIVEPTLDEGKWKWRVLSSADVKERATRDRLDGSLEQLPFADGALDRVYLPDVVYWYFAPKRISSLGLESNEAGHRILSEAIRVTSPGGEVRFNVGTELHPLAWAQYFAQRFRDRVRVALKGDTIIFSVTDTARCT